MLQQRAVQLATTLRHDPCGLVEDRPATATAVSSRLLAAPAALPDELLLLQLRLQLAHNLQDTIFRYRLQKS